jgi:hypothetical protein
MNPIPAGGKQEKKEKKKKKRINFLQYTGGLENVRRTDDKVLFRAILSR